MKYLFLLFSLHIAILGYAKEAEELHLPNGMTVYLKPFDNGEKTVSIELIAPFGFASFPKEMQASLRLAPDVVWASGVGKFNADQLTNLLYDNSLEFNYSVDPLYHYILGETEIDNIDILFDLIVSFLENPHFKEESLKEVIQNYRSDLLKKDPSEAIEKAYYELNGFDRYLYSPISVIDLSDVTLDSIKSAFQKLFGNPSLFTCVVVGDFPLEKVKASIEKKLGNLPNISKTPLPLYKDTMRFPEKNVTLSTTEKNTTENLIRITFPMPFAITEENFYLVDLTTQALETSLRDLMEKTIQNTAAIDVSFELPLYPLKKDLWVTVQMRVPAKQSDYLIGKVLKHLPRLQKEGFAEKRLEQAEENIKTSDESWQNDNEYWVNFLTNAALLNFNPETLYKNRMESYRLKKEALDRFLKTFSFEHYTIFITTP